MRRQRLARRRSSGFTLIELMIALAIGAVITTIYQGYQILEAAENAVADGTGEYLLVVRDGLVRYQQENFTALSNGSPVSGYADPLAPTIDELKTAKKLPPGLPSTTAGGKAVRTLLTRDSCPGASCVVRGIAYVNAAFTVGRTGTATRLDLALQAVQTMKGAGGMSFQDAPGTIRGAAGSATNPLGNVAGVVAAFSFMDTSFYNQFVRMNDTRDPNLQGALSVAGAGKFGGTLDVAGLARMANGVDVTGDATASGRIVARTSGCDRAVVDSTGAIALRAAGCGASPVVGMDATSSQIYARNAAGTATVVTQGSNGTVTMRDAAAVSRVVLNGGSGSLDVADAGGTTKVRLDGAAGRMSTSIASITSTAVVNTACIPGFSDGDIVRDADARGTILLCQAGVWRRPGLESATAGSTCPTPGALGQDGAGAALICRGTTWASLNDRVTRSVLVDRWLVMDGNSVPRPSCASGATPSILVTPADTGSDYAGTPPRNRFTATVAVSGSNWIVQLQLADATGTRYSSSFTGTPYNFQAIAQTYCDFPS